ncbi:hypothetical protein SETIT_5G028000v2 [Setaria italica]|uniref:Uncharacterized protein n=1 Tax=Setaria italica TaxID=4555 RepID=K3XSC8_SETIT|nr:hypothetical protein SETIT_5G028000v2 [Setaria italica]
MGNLVSQGVGRGAGMRPLVLVRDGSRTRVEEHTGVAELMIDTSGHVVACAFDVIRERRVRAMAADELLHGGEVYLLVHANRESGARLSDREVLGHRVVGLKEEEIKEEDAHRQQGQQGLPVDLPDGQRRKGGSICQKWAQDHYGIEPRQWRSALDTMYET